MEALEPGTVVAADYRVIRTLYTGGLSIIYEAEQVSTGARRALKVVHGDLGKDAEVRAAFLSEAKKATKIQSEHVAEVLGCGGDPETGVPWVAMELIEGQSLAKYVEQHGPMEPAQVLELMTQLGHAIAAAHDVGVVHRDLKPEGIVLGKSRSPTASFWVEVQFVGVGKIASEIKRNTTAAMSRALWMAPEQSETDAPVTPATDVWTMGLLAFWLLTGRHYWKTARDMGSAMMSLMREILFEPLEPAHTRAESLGVGGRIPPGFDGWFEQAVARDGKKRFQHAREAIDALASLLGAPKPTAVGPLPPMPRPPPPKRDASSAGATKRDPSSSSAPSDRPPMSEAPMSLRSKRKFWRLVGIVTASILLVVGGAGGGYKYWTDRKAAEKKAHDAIEEAKRDEEREAERKRRKALAEWTDEESPVPASFKDPSWGDRAAPVTIVIFSELECTACKALDATLTELKKSYGPKTLRVIWKHNPASSHKIGRQAAIAGHAVFRSTGSEAFFKYVSKGFASGKDDLYGFQIEEWVREAGVKKTVEYNKLKLEKETEEKVDADVALAATLGVKASPACFINGVLVKGAIPLAKLKSVVDEQVTKAQAEVDKGTAKEQVYVTLSKAQFVSKEERLKALEPPKDDDKAALKVPVTDSPALGPATALVTIVEFGDFDCPHCQSVHKTLLELKASYGDKLRLVWKDNPLPNHYRARAAANFARDVRAQKGDEAFWKVHGLMLESGKLSEDDLKGYAKKVGVKVPGAIDASTQGTHDAKIRLDQDLAESLDATGTPTFFINGRRLVGAKQKTEIEALIKEEETKAQALLSGGTAASSLYDEIMKSAKDPSDAVTKIVSPGDPPYGAPKRGATLPSVVIQHFGDIESPATKKVEQTLDRIVDKYRDQVQVVWRHRPMEDHEHAVDLAHAAEDLKSQVSDAAFFSFVKAASGKSGTPGAFDLPNIQALAQEAGKVDRYGYVSIYSIKNAIDEKKHEAKLNADLLKASELEIQIAPTVIVGKELLVSPVTFARVKKLVDKSLGK